VKKVLDFKVSKTRDFSEDGYIDEDNESLPRENFIQIFLENGFSLAIRPSGTEPKIKYYIFGNGEANPSDLEASKLDVSSTLDSIGQWLVEDAHKRVKES